MKTFYLFIFILSSTSSIASTKLRQHRLILPTDPGNYELCCIFLPPEGFKIFKSQDWKQIGVLTRNPGVKKRNNSEYEIYFIDNDTNTATRIDIKNFKEIGYEIFAITYVERRNGFVRIINDSVDFWVSEQEITNKNFRLVDWQQFYIEKADEYIGFYPKDPGLDLKEKPSFCSESKIKLVGHLFEINPTKEVDGRWTRVKVKKYKEHPCASGNFAEENVEFLEEGWIEIVTATGELNLWYYPRGC